MPASNILNRTRRAMRDRSQLHKRPLVGIPFSVTVAHTNEAMGDKWSCSQAVSNRMKNVEKASAAKVKGDKANDAKKSRDTPDRRNDDRREGERRSGE